MLAAPPTMCPPSDCLLASINQLQVKSSIADSLNNQLIRKLMPMVVYALSPMCGLQNGTETLNHQLIRKHLPVSGTSKLEQKTLITCY